MKEKVNKRLEKTSSDYKKALIKKALGYDSTETVCEYVSDDDGEIKLTKKKVTKKNVPPDITALKILIEDMDKSVGQMSDEELEEERKRLINLLALSQEKKEK